MNLANLIFTADFIAVAAFAVSGGLAASRAQLDIVGLFVIAAITGVGGGTVRDMLLGRLPVFWVENPVYLAAAGLGALIVALFQARLASRRTALIWADAAGLAVAVALGVAAAWAFGAHWVVVILMGVMSGTFGGMIRDVICNEIPLILREDIYALAGCAGASLHVALLHLSIAPGVAGVCGAMTTFAVRAAAIHWRLSLPPMGAPPRQ